MSRIAVGRGRLFGLLASGLFVSGLCSGPIAAAAGEQAACSPLLTRQIPQRDPSAPTGDQFAAAVASDESQQREVLIAQEIVRGNLPGFLRRLVPVRLAATLPGGRSVDATLCVMPDYLAIGSDRNFLRVPMSLHTALEVAARLGFVLPTRKVVDAIHRQSLARLGPQPKPPGPQMRSTAYYAEHNRSIRAQRLSLGIPLGVLISGHKKDVVLSGRLANHPGRIAIYGWHRLDGRPIQPLSTVHGASYADYSHGIRLVSDTMYLDGEPTSVRRVLQDPALAGILSDEGPVPIVARLLPARSGPIAHGAGDARNSATGGAAARFPAL